MSRRGALEYVRLLAAWPHRGSCTVQEAEAAERCAALLRGLGYEVEIDAFKAPLQTLYNGILFLLRTYALAGVLAFWSPGAALAVALLLLIPIWGELSGGRPDFDVFVPKGRSQNVIARSPRQAAGGDEPEAPARLHIILTAHLDTQFGSALFAPGFVRYTPLFFTVNYAAIALTVVALALRAAGVWLGAALALQIVAWAIMLAGYVFIFYAKVTGGYVNGANDNASGVAVALDLAARLRDDAARDDTVRDDASPFDVTVLLTGAEEVGERGMKRFLARHGGELDRTQTCFINIDNVGGGVLRYQLGEGMLTYYKYSERLTRLAATLASDAGRDGGRRVLPLRNTMLPTDALIPTRRGFAAITFIAQNEDGTIPNYHWHTDRLEGVDTSLVAFAADFIWRYLRALPDAWAVPQDDASHTLAGAR